MPKPKPARRPFTLRMYFEWLAICIGVAGLVCLTNVVNLYLQAKPLAEAPECPRERAEQNDSADCRLLTRAVVESVVPNKFNALVNLKVPVRGDTIMCLALGLLGLTSRVVRRKREAAAAA
ncbi:MAG: hypothetical protein IPJ65_40955 [Archangiaceae bacterium]|nr:hypothetical protein [Archangiaceae bacterium]